MLLNTRYIFNLIDGEYEDASFWVNKYTIYKLDTSKEPLTREKVLTFPVQRFTYLHEFAQTENYIIINEFPAFWNIGKLTNPLFNDPSKLTLSWHPEKGTNIIIIDLKKKEVVRRIKHKAYWSYHQINAYETHEYGHKDNKIVMDICTFDTAEHLETFELRTLKKNTWQIPPNINRRFYVPLTFNNKTDKSTDLDTDTNIKVENVGPIGFDLPTKNYENVGRYYKYGFGVKILFIKILIYIYIYL